VRDGDVPDVDDAPADVRDGGQGVVEQLLDGLVGRRDLRALQGADDESGVDRDQLEALPLG